MNPPENQAKPKRSISLKTIRTWVFLVIFALLCGNIGYRMGVRGVTFGVSPERQIVINAETPPDREVDFSLFWDVWGRLEQKYLDKTKLDTQKMVHGAISGMVSSLGDPYTVFLPPKENEDFKGDLSGEFEGVGAQLGSKEEKIIVIAPLKDHPAEKAGIRAGDWIVQVNGEDTFGWTVPQAVSKIRGPKGSSVTLQVLSEGEEKPRDLKVTRDTITIKSVEVEFRTSTGCTENCSEVAYIKLARFGDQTNDEWGQVVSSIRSRQNTSKLAGVVLDMRNNPGGYFQSAIHIASEFIKNGVVVIQENSDGTRETFSVTRVGSLLDIPLTVLINKGSASASEIVAGALRDHNRGKLVGEKTFGKGSVQQPEDLPDGSGIHITTARWIMPKGEWINGTGIKPDIEVLPPEGTASAELDPQLDRAILELSK